MDISTVEPESEPKLYSTNARENGMDFNMRIWEAERLPKVSVLRGTTDRSADALGLHVLALKAWVEVGQLRGYDYVVLLSEKSSPLEVAFLGADEFEYTVGLTNSPTPDVATEFPDFYRGPRNYLVLPAEYSERMFMAYAKWNIEEHGEELGIDPETWPPPNTTLQPTARDRG